MRSRWYRLPAVMCFFLVTALTACRLQRTGNMNVQQITGGKKSVALVAKSAESAFWKTVRAGANAASTEYNLDLIFEAPLSEEDYAAQNEMIESVVSGGVDAIVFSAVDFEANAEAVDWAAAEGVKIVVIDSEVNSSAVECYIGTDNYEAGCLAGEAALACEEPAMNIGIVNYDKNSENGQTREAGFRDTVAEDERAVIVDAINVNSTTEEAKEGTLAMIDRNPQINVIATFNEWTSLGVGYAIQERGLEDEIHVVAFDSNVVSVGMLETGEVDALIVQNPYAMGYLGVENAYSLINGQSITDKEIGTSLLIVTKENMYDDESQRLLFSFDK